MRLVIGMIGAALLLAGSVGVALASVRPDAKASDQCSRFHEPRPYPALQTVDYDRIRMSGSDAR